MLDCGEAFGDSQMEERGRRKYGILCSKNTSLSKVYQMIDSYDTSARLFEVSGR